MSASTSVRALTLAIGAVLTAIAIALQADIAPPVLSAEATTIAERSVIDEGAEAASYPPGLPLDSQLCPC